MKHYHITSTFNALLLYWLYGYVQLMYIAMYS